MRRHGRARSEGHTAWVKYYQSPTDGFVINYWNPAPAGEREALTSQNQTAKNWAAQHSGVLRSNWSMEAAFASYSSQLFASIIQGFADTFANVPQQEKLRRLPVERQHLCVFAIRPRRRIGFHAEHEAEALSPGRGYGGLPAAVRPEHGCRHPVIGRRWRDLIDDIRTFRADGSINRQVVNYDAAERSYKRAARQLPAPGPRKLHRLCDRADLAHRRNEPGWLQGGNLQPHQQRGEVHQQQRGMVWRDGECSVRRRGGQFRQGRRPWIVPDAAAVSLLADLPLLKDVTARWGLARNARGRRPRARRRRA